MNFLKKLPRLLFGGCIVFFGVVIIDGGGHVLDTMKLMLRSAMEFSSYNLTIFAGLVLLFIFLLLLGLFFAILGLSFINDIIWGD